MRRTVLQISLSVVICLSLLYFTYGRELIKQVETSDRYYTGIGVRLSTDGDRTTINRVLADGPAFKAGIRRGDIILAVDSQPVAGPNEGPITKLTEGGWAGSTVSLKILRIEETTRELEFRVERRLIDRAAWVLMDWPLNTGMEIIGGRLLFSSKVSEDKTRGVFVYFCKIQNDSKRKYTVEWQILGKIYGTKISVEMNPGETREFYSESPRVPESSAGDVIIYNEVTRVARGVANGYAPGKI